MFVLFEKADFNGTDSIDNYDAMGYAETEQDAADWIANNEENRKYKYCTDMKYTM